MMTSNFPSRYQGDQFIIYHQGVPISPSPSFPPSRHQSDPNSQNTPWDVYWLKVPYLKSYNRDKRVQSLSWGVCGGGVKGIRLWSMGRGPGESVVHGPRTSLLRHWPRVGFQSRGFVHYLSRVPSHWASSNYIATILEYTSFSTCHFFNGSQLVKMDSLHVPATKFIGRSSWSKMVQSYF